MPIYTNEELEILMMQVSSEEPIEWSKDNFNISDFLRDFNEHKNRGEAHVFIFRNSALLEKILSNPETIGFILHEPDEPLKDFLSYLHSLAFTIQKFGVEDIYVVGMQGAKVELPNPIPAYVRQSYRAFMDQFYKDGMAASDHVNGFAMSLSVNILKSLQSLPNIYGNYRGPAFLSDINADHLE